MRSNLPALRNPQGMFSCSYPHSAGVPMPHDLQLEVACLAVIWTRCVIKVPRALGRHRIGLGTGREITSPPGRAGTPLRLLAPTALVSFRHLSGKDEIPARGTRAGASRNAAGPSAGTRSRRCSRRAGCREEPHLALTSRMPCLMPSPAQCGRGLFGA